MLYTQNNLVYEALASGGRVLFKTWASLEFRQQLFANKYELFQYFTDWYGIINVFTHKPNTCLFFFFF